MNAVGFYEGLPIEDEDCFIDLRVAIPEIRPHDVLVHVQAVSVNPVDTKLRQTSPKQEKFTILGFDAVGYVERIGTEVTEVSIGDRVFYSGTTTRSGSNQDYQAVDSRIIAKAPVSLLPEEAAALPLTSLTAYELLFEKFELIPEKEANTGNKLLIINGAGGVGSVMSQLATWAGLDVIATASPKNFNWLNEHGVTHAIDYHGDLKKELNKIGIDRVEYLAVLHDIVPYMPQLGELIQPFGHIGTIVGTNQSLEIGQWKNQSISFDWEYMFAKTDYHYKIETQGEILTKISKLVDEGQLQTTVTKVYKEGLNAQAIRKATKDVETGHMVGKVVVCAVEEN